MKKPKPRKQVQCKACKEYFYNLMEFNHHKCVAEEKANDNSN